MDLDMDLSGDDFVCSERSKFSVGELVRFRSWEDMKSEFGFDGSAIPCMFTFTSVMRDSGLNNDFIFTITDIADDGEIYGHGTGWCVSEDMLEHVEDLPYDSSEIDEFLSSMTVKGE